MRRKNLSDQNKREFLILPLELCFFDRTRYDKLYSEMPLEITSYRKYDTGIIRIFFSASTSSKKAEMEGRTHLLWIQLIDIQEKKYVKFRCDCKYFEYRLLRPAKRNFAIRELNNDLVIIINPESFNTQKSLFNIDKHAYLALRELFNIHIQISI